MPSTSPRTSTLDAHQARLWESFRARHTASGADVGTAGRKAWADFKRLFEQTKDGWRLRRRASFMGSGPLTHGRSSLSAARCDKENRRVVVEAAGAGDRSGFSSGAQAPTLADYRAAAVGVYASSLRLAEAAREDAHLRIALEAVRQLRAPLRDVSTLTESLRVLVQEFARRDEKAVVAAFEAARGLDLREDANAATAASLIEGALTDRFGRSEAPPLTDGLSAAGVAMFRRRFAELSEASTTSMMCRDGGKFSPCEFSALKASKDPAVAKFMVGIEDAARTFGVPEHAIHVVMANAGASPSKSDEANADALARIETRSFDYPTDAVRAAMHVLTKLYGHLSRDDAKKRGALNEPRPVSVPPMVRESALDRFASLTEEWDEEDHPRDENGRFASSSGESSGSSAATPRRRDGEYQDFRHYSGQGKRKERTPEQIRASIRQGKIDVARMAFKKAVQDDEWFQYPDGPGTPAITWASEEMRLAAAGRFDVSDEELNRYLSEGHDDMGTSKAALDRFAALAEGSCGTGVPVSPPEEDEQRKKRMADLARSQKNQVAEGCHDEDPEDDEDEAMREARYFKRKAVGTYRVRMHESECAACKRGDECEAKKNVAAEVGMDPDDDDFEINYGERVKRMLARREESTQGDGDERRKAGKSGRAKGPGGLIRRDMPPVLAT